MRCRTYATAVAKGAGANTAAKLALAFEKKFFTLIRCE